MAFQGVSMQPHGVLMYSPHVFLEPVEAVQFASEISLKFMILLPLGTKLLPLTDRPGLHSHGDMFSSLLQATQVPAIMEVFFFRSALDIGTRCLLPIECVPYQSELIVGIVPLRQGFISLRLGTGVNAICEIDRIDRHERHIHKKGYLLED